MEPRSKQWIAPLTGTGFIVLAIVSLFVGGQPKDAKHPAREIVQWYIDNKDAVSVSAFIGIAAVVLLTFFGAYLRRVLRDADDGQEILSLVAFAGVAIVGVGIAIDATIQIAISEAADDISPVGVQALQALWDNDFVPLALGILLFLWGTGLSVVRTGVLPKWLGWVMLALGVIGLTPIGFVSGLGAAILVLVLSIMLTLRARTPSTVVTG
jgi:hypothetical protein